MDKLDDAKFLANELDRYEEGIVGQAIKNAAGKVVNGVKDIVANGYNKLQTSVNNVKAANVQNANNTNAKNAINKIVDFLNSQDGKNFFFSQQNNQQQNKNQQQDDKKSDNSNQQQQSQDNREIPENSEKGGARQLNDQETTESLQDSLKIDSILEKLDKLDEALSKKQQNISLNLFGNKDFLEKVNNGTVVSADIENALKNPNTQKNFLDKFINKVDSLKGFANTLADYSKTLQNQQNNPQQGDKENTAPQQGEPQQDGKENPAPQKDGSQEDQSNGGTAVTDTSNIKIGDADEAFTNPQWGKYIGALMNVAGTKESLLNIAQAFINKANKMQK